MDTGGFVAPTFGQRLGGRLLDSLLFLPLALLFFAALGTAGRVLTIVLYASYEIACVTTTGRTLGKMAVGTRVVDASTGGPVAAPSAVVRDAVLFGPGVVLGFLGLGLAALLWTVVMVVMVQRPPLHRGPHDFAARTIVVPTKIVSPR